MKSVRWTLALRLLPLLFLGVAWVGCTVDFTGSGDEPDGGEPGCGNGILEPGEACDGTDFGNQDCASVVQREMGSLSCNATCGLDVSGCHDCGNGRTDSDETCDDVNGDAGDGCMGCQLETGWTCAGEPSVCATICGDGLVLGVEACDDGNNTNGDGCTGGCGGEAGWVCSGQPSQCAQTCGNGVLDTGEACDDGNLNFDDGCSPSCVVDTGWDCVGAPSVCAPVCGDGVVLPGEACDDGNTATGDGCLADCTVEDGWDCDFTGSPPQGCIPICGDGQLLGDEACDDGDSFSGDGCSSTCQIEAYTACDGEPSQCTCVVYVDRDPLPGSRDGQSWATAYDLLEDALWAAYIRRPCEIWVAEGTYYTYRFGWNDDLSLYDDTELYGGFDGTETWRDQRDWLAHPTVISGEQEGNPSNRVRTIFQASGDQNVVIDGFTIERGNAINAQGGGIQLDNNSSVSMSHVVFADNEAENGGAIYLTGGAELTVTDATFLNNIAERDGGALFAESWGDVTLDRCLFQGNQASMDDGGAISTDGVNLGVSRSRFDTNTAGRFGGAVRFVGPGFSMSNSVLWSNYGLQGGGGVSFSISGQTGLIVNCTFYENGASPGNGATIRISAGDVDIYNSILWGTSTNQVYEFVGGNANLDYCNVRGNAPGSGNIDQVPLFVSTAMSDFHLAAGSPGIDAATGFVAPADDLEGNARFDDPNTFNSGNGTPDFVDMGAYEYWP